MKLVNKPNLGSLFFLPVGSALATFFLMLLLGHKLDRQEDKLVGELVKEEQAHIQSEISSHVKNAVISLRRMAQRWQARDGLSEYEWRADARNYIQDFAGLTTVEWADNSYHVRWVEPLEGNEKALGLNILFNKEREDALKGAAEKHAITLTPPLDLVQGCYRLLANLC